MKDLVGLPDVDQISVLTDGMSLARSEWRTQKSGNVQGMVVRSLVSLLHKSGRAAPRHQAIFCGVWVSRSKRVVRPSTSSGEHTSGFVGSNEVYRWMRAKSVAKIAKLWFWTT